MSRGRAPLIGSGPAVLDASAVMALVHGEPGADHVRSRLRGSFLSAVNLSEALAKGLESRASLEDFAHGIATLRLGVEPFDADLAQRAAALRPLTRAAGLSLGDRACLALAQKLGLPALTADGAWRGLEVGIRIEHIR